MYVVASLNKKKKKKVIQEGLTVMKKTTNIGFFMDDNIFNPLYIYIYIGHCVRYTELL